MLNTPLSSTSSKAVSNPSLSVILCRSEKQRLNRRFTPLLEKALKKALHNTDYHYFLRADSLGKRLLMAQAKRSPTVKQWLAMIINEPVEELIEALSSSDPEVDVVKACRQFTLAILKRFPHAEFPPNLRKPFGMIHQKEVELYKSIASSTDPTVLSPSMKSVVLPPKTWIILLELINPVIHQHAKQVSSDDDTTMAKVSGIISVLQKLSLGKSFDSCDKDHKHFNSVITDHSVQQAQEKAYKAFLNRINVDSLPTTEK